jgi:hypothetical protein
MLWKYWALNNEKKCGWGVAGCHPPSGISLIFLTKAVYIREYTVSSITINLK